MKNTLIVLFSLLVGIFSSTDRLQPQVSFTVGGDVMLDRMVRKTYPNEKLATIFEHLKNTSFSHVDASIINLEGPVSETVLGPEYDLVSLIFNFPPESISALKNLGINGVSLANNHTSNAGKTGLAATRQLLSRSQIAAIGGPEAADVFSIATFSGRLLNLVVIAVNTLSGTPDITPLIKEIKSDKNNRLLIFPHWGNEYQPSHSNGQQRLARLWIDSGADIIIGSHPHVVQDTEIYKNKPIIYSLGNLVFDQTFSRQTQHGLVVNGVFTNKGLTLTTNDIQIINYQPVMSTASATSFYP